MRAGVFESFATVQSLGIKAPDNEMGTVTQPFESSGSSDGRKTQSERTQPVFLLIESHSHSFQTRTRRVSASSLSTTYETVAIPNIQDKFSRLEYHGGNNAVQENITY